MQETQPAPDQAWHQRTTEQVIAGLHTDLDSGLSAETAEARAADHGPNIITARKGDGPIKRALAQLVQPLVLILIIAGVATAALQEWVDSGVIFGVVLLNAVIGFLQESKAAKAIDALSRSITTQATVVRDGRRMLLPAQVLVPGDIVVLQAGDKVPADLRLVHIRDLRIDESALTGESVSVDKSVQPLPLETTLPERVNMSYASTLVAAGQGTGVVVAIGDQTEIGRISELLAGVKDSQTPLTRKIAQFSKVLLLVILGLAAVTAVVGLVRGNEPLDMFLAAVALAVGAIPEGMPAAVTITLAIGVSRMAHRRAVIRKLPAVETLGSTTVICSDKTGTLTKNQMTVQLIIVDGTESEVTGVGYEPRGEIVTAGHKSGGATPSRAVLELLRAGVLCNDVSVYEEDGVWHIQGDPTEGALLVAAAKGGVNHETIDRHFPRLDTIPFESEKQYMATLHETDLGDASKRTIYAKGAVERILHRCESQIGGDGSLGRLDAATVEVLASRMASEGLRVLAFASKPGRTQTDLLDESDLAEGLVFLGLQGMIDPPREEAIEAVRACHAAGVQVKMITGDHALTATAIARQLGLGEPGCDETELIPVTGAELEKVSDLELADLVERTYVFARVTPEQKLRLVNALQMRNHVVAMTGDGVNDAPALRRADIGVAMGVTGTEVAKEASDMILTDDNFASIEAAVEEGRGVFDNLTKFITWTLPTNLGEGLVVLAAVFAGVALPICPYRSYGST